MLEADYLERDLQGAAEAEGAEVVKDAIAQVVHRTAPPEALIAWIDELRDPEVFPLPDAEVPAGFIHDFEADTEMAGGTPAARDADDGDDVPIDAPGAHAGGSDDDDASDYLFSATRRRRAEEEDGDPDADLGDKVVPVAAAKAPKPSSSNRP